jgi:hypothetical protein
MLAAREDPIVGVDQRSTEYLVKLYNNFCDHPSPGKDQYSKRSMTAVLSTSEKVSQRSLLFRLLSPS